MQSMRLRGQQGPASVTPFTCRRLHLRVVPRAAAGNGQTVAGNTTIHKLIEENGILLIPGEVPRGSSNRLLAFCIQQQG